LITKGKCHQIGFTYLWRTCTKFDLGSALPRTPAEGAYS